MISRPPTHYICKICDANFYVATDKRIMNKCPNCGQQYELVPTRFGNVAVLINKDGSGVAYLWQKE